MGGVGKFISNAPKNAVTGLSHAVSSPKNALLNLSTLGQYGLYSENKKGYTSAASSGAGAFVASGGNPFAAILGAGIGAVKGGTDKQSQLGSAGQSLAYGALLGSLFSVGGAISASKAVPGSGPLGANGPIAPGSSTSLGSKIATLFSNSGSKALTSIAGAGKTLTLAGLVAGAQKYLGGKPSAGDQQAYGNAQDTAAGAGFNPSNVPQPDNQGGVAAVLQNPTAPANVLKIAAFILVPGGLAYLAWRWWKHRKR